MSITPVLSDKPEIPVPARSEPASLYRYSTWVHVGVGAEGCAEVDEAQGVNGCGDRAHFHAWCRLQNPLQQAEIRERALAAKARKIRQLRDPATDGYEILEEEFEARAREGDRGRAAAIEELLELDFWRDYYQAMQDVRQLDDPNSDEDDVKRFARIADDQARLLRLEGMPDRPSDEYEELQRHVAAYQEAIDEELKRIGDPKRAALEALDTGGLLAQLRDKRIEAESQREFQRVFEIHQWLSCAYRHRGGPPAFADLAALEQAAPEVIEGLQAVFLDLGRTAQEAQGN